MPTSIETQGTTLHYSTTTSPTTWALVGNIVDFSGPGGQASVIDVSNLDSTFREKRMGLPDEGQFTLNVNLDPDNTAHIALKNNRAARTRTEFKITLTDSTPTILQFQGYILGFVLTGGVDAVVKAAITIEIDGPVTWQ